MRDSKIDYRQLEQLKANLEAISKESDAFFEAAAKELAARLLSKVIRRTPVGQYPKGSGKVGGTLMRGWTSGKSQSAAAFANSLPVHHYGDTYVIEVINPVEYASYVEFGHRTAGGNGWVEGRHMLTISEEEIKRDATGILEAKLKKWLAGADGK